MSKDKKSPEQPMPQPEQKAATPPEEQTLEPIPEAAPSSSSDPECPNRSSQKYATAVARLLDLYSSTEGTLSPWTTSLRGHGKSELATEWLRRLELSPRIADLESGIAQLRSQIDQQEKEYLTERASSKKKEAQIAQLEADRRTLIEKQRLAHLLNRVGEAAQHKLLESESFREEFARDIPRPAYVLSIDIRRSTELMLKAREPKFFAEFIITLARQLREVIMRNYGVFDKFTGDGILAFFPEFYSGPDAGFLAMKSAAECHEIFSNVYKSHRRCFVSILQGAGLGIGLDYGNVHIVQIGGDVTVVGTPVVYACRMSGGDPGTTFANEPAYERLFGDFSEYCDFEEDSLEIKHEGLTLTHRAHLNGKEFTPRLPQWEGAERTTPN